MSVIQILYRDEVVALSHLIGSESLPKPGQVCKNMVSEPAVFKMNALSALTVFNGLVSTNHARVAFHTIQCMLFYYYQVGLPFRCVTLEQQKGERAMLIRNAKGDWGIVKTQWVFFRRGYIPDDDGKNPLLVYFERHILGIFY